LSVRGMEIALWLQLRPFTPTPCLFNWEISLFKRLVSKG
jgi:hypothetical protein